MAHPFFNKKRTPEEKRAWMGARNCWRKERTAKEKESTRERNFQKLYGISSKEYDALWIEQIGRCAICYRSASQFKRELDVDHCHETGKVRGLLCNNCNQGMGSLRDSVEILQNAIGYLNAA